MTSCGRYNIRKRRKIKNGEQYIALEISFKLDCLDKRGVASSESRDYMVRSGKGLTTSLTLRTKRPNKKQKARTAITDITNQYFRKLIKYFSNFPYLGYKEKQVHNEPTEAYFFLIKHIYKLIKSKNRIWLCTKIVKSDVDGKKLSMKQLNASN